MMGVAWCFALLLLVTTVNCNIDIGQFEIASVDRKIDMSSQLVKVSSVLDIENTGSKSANSFIFTVEPQFMEYLSFITANAKNSDESFDVFAAAGQKNVFKIGLSRNLAPKEKISVEVRQVFRSMLSPFPKEIKQSEQQFVITHQNAHLYSPYKVKTQTTTFVLASTKVVSYTKLDPYVLTDKKIEYGPFENVAANSVAEVVIHYENYSPFLTITSLERWVEVSHWGGNIAVEETIQIKHTGAKLLGSFSRFDYMYSRGHDTMPSVKSYKTVLPAGAKDVYYRDEIGNISTSNLLELLDSVEMEIRPRYPLFGGWITHYMLGYNLPSFQYLFHSGSSHVLKMRFLDHVFDDMSVDEMVLKIVLPEGASGIELKVPYDYEREKDSLHYTFLDFTGRPVVTISKKNLVEEHIQDFELHYNFNSIMLLREPVMLIAGLMLLFLTVIAFVRLDFSISIDASAESKMRVAGALEQLLSLQGKRESLFSKLEDAIASFRQNRNSETMQSVKKSVEAELKDVKSAIEQVAKSVREDNIESAEKIVELQRLEGIYHGFIVDSIQNANKVVAGSITQEAFKRVEENNEQKKYDTRLKINKVMSTM